MPVLTTGLLLVLAAGLVTGGLIGAVGVGGVLLGACFAHALPASRLRKLVAVALLGTAALLLTQLF